MTGFVLAATGFKREAALIVSPRVRVVVGGGEGEALQARLKAAAEGAKAVVSVGLAGALSPALRVGGWIVADEVVSGRRRWPTDAGWRRELQRALPSATIGALAGGEVMVATAAAKAALHAMTGALAVDMESHVAARFAEAHGLPFAALRVISDAADRDLPKAAQAGMKADGGMDVLAVLLKLARDPRQLPALIRTGREAQVAFRQLALLGRHDLLGRSGVGELDLGQLRLDVT